jgi:hypothetical protein
MTPDYDAAVRAANKALDEPWVDPDDDLRTISRQFLRTIEVRDTLMQAVRSTLVSLSQSDNIPLIVLRDVRERLNDLNQRLNLP